MAYNEQLTLRIRKALENTPGVEEKNMFRGTSFLVNGKMCITTGNEEYLFRIDPARHETALQQPGTRAMMMKGKVYRGYIYVHQDAVSTTPDLANWVKQALELNQNISGIKSKKRPSK